MFKNLIKSENLLYIILILVASVVAIDEYGSENLFVLIVVLYSIIQLVFNFSKIYSLVKKKIQKRTITFNGREKAIVLGSSLLIVVLFFTVLTEYFQHFVLYCTGMILFLLLVYDIGKLVLYKR